MIIIIGIIVVLSTIGLSLLSLVEMKGRKLGYKVGVILLQIYYIMIILFSIGSIIKFSGV